MAEKQFTQDDIDKAVNEQKAKDKKALDDLKAKFDTTKQALDDFKAKQPGLIDDAKKRGQELAKMTSDQRAKTELKEKQDAANQAIKENQDFKAKYLRKSKVLDIQQQLQDNGIDKSLADGLYDADEDVCKQKVNNFIDKWKAALDKQVADKMKGQSTPQGGDGNANTDATEPIKLEDYKKMSLDKRMEYAAKNPEAYKKLQAGGNE